MLENLLDPILRPLLNLGFFWAIFVASFVLTLLITLVYKFATDQALMKKLKDEMKVLQKEMKALKDNPSKAMAHQKKVMEKNMQYMKHSLKPTLFTFIPIIIIFGWLNANLAFMPIEPDTNFMVSVEFQEGTFGEVTLDSLPELIYVSGLTQEIKNGRAEWTLSGNTGEYLLKVIHENREYEKDLLISSELKYATPVEVIKNSNLEKITIHNEKVMPLGKFSIFGWHPGWLGTYIIFSLIFSFALRKMLGIS